MKGDIEAAQPWLKQAERQSVYNCILIYYILIYIFAERLYIMYT